MSITSLKDSIARWLLRPTASLGVRPVAQAAAVVGSSRGRVRTENQDKAVVASFESDDPRKNFRVFLVCDGLGGMREGERCAAEAIAHFICDLVHTASISDRSERLRSAIAYTNSELWKIFNERGGTTIAAILLTDTGATAVAVGDTRIYKHGEKGDLFQLTVDDTIAGRLAELTDSPVELLAGGPFAHHLAQIIGQGSSVTPQLLDADVLLNGAVQRGDVHTRHGLVVATDGAYRIGKDTLDDLARHATSARELVHRVISVAEWIGGDDNATAMYISLNEALARSNGNKSPTPGLQIHDAFGELHLVAVEFEKSVSQQKVASPTPPALLVSTQKPERGRDSSKGRRKRTGTEKRKGKGKGNLSRKSKAEKNKQASQPELDIKVTQQSE